MIISFQANMVFCTFFFFQAEDGIRDLVRSRGLGDVYKRQGLGQPVGTLPARRHEYPDLHPGFNPCAAWRTGGAHRRGCLLYTSDAADERSSVDLGGRRIIKKQKKRTCDCAKDRYKTGMKMSTSQ